MYSTEIKRALSAHPKTRNIFRGVYSSDKLPHYMPYKSIAIANTDMSTGKGKHWVLLYMRKDGTLEFFDSYGNTPDFYNDYLNTLAKIYPTECNGSQCQAVGSSVCGQYCLFYAIMRQSAFDMSDVIHMFTNNYKANDRMVCAWVNKHFRFQLPLDIRDQTSRMLRKMDVGR